MLTVDEDREQTRRIHALQREKRTLAGLAKREARTAILATHQNAQRLLRSLAVVNPYADRLTFLDDRTRTRRDHEKYLTLIDVIALLHQHQREIKTAHIAGRSVEYIEATLDDIAQANAIAHEVLGRSLDELPPQTRRVLAMIVGHFHARTQAGAMRREDVRFTRAELRAASGFGNTQLKVHLARLAELEYLITHRAERGQGFVYELLFDGDAAAIAHLSGLIDVESLKARDYDAQRSWSETERSDSQAPQSAPGRGAVGQRSGPGRSSASAAKPALARLPADPANEGSKTPISGADVPPVMSYPKAVPSLAAAAAA